ncbi:MAG: protein kinase [Isosphaeraceae bacterium]
MALDEESSSGLRIGLLGLREGLISEEQLQAAIEVCLSAPGRRLDEVLLANGLLDPERLACLREAVGQQPTGEPLHDSQLTVAYHGPSRDIGPEGRARQRGTPMPTDGIEPRFRVLRSHARGGLGEVFLAVDPQLKRQVALKAMQSQFASDQVSEARFLLEAELTAGLEHPGIVPVYAFGRDSEGRPYYVMRFIEGETLKAAIARFHGPAGQRLGPRERALTFRRLLQSLVAACNTVAYAHSRGVVHRDLKPDNIMLGPFGETLVLDWGIAKSRESLIAAEGPEAGRDAEADASLTRPGSALGTPRYMSPEQASGDLDAVGPASDVYGLGSTLYFLLTGKPAFPDAGVAETLDRVRRGIFPAPRMLVRSVDPALEAICLKAMSLRPEDRHTSALVLGEEIEAWLADVRYRGEQVQAVRELQATLARLAIERAQNLLRREQFDQGMLWLARALENVPDGEPGLERAVRSSLGSWHARSRLLERSIPQGGEILALALSPDGRRLATGTDASSGRLWDMATGHSLCNPLVHPGPVSAVVFSGDGRRVATAGPSGTLRLWDAMTGETVGRPISHGVAIHAICFSPDGSVLASASRANVPGLWRVETGEPLHRPDEDAVDVLAVAFEPSGRVVASARKDGRVACRNARTGEPEGPEFRHEAAVTSLCFSPDGRALLTGCLDGKARLWKPTEAGAPARELAMAAGICQVEWSPSRDLVATSCLDGSARLWDASAGQPIGESLVHDARIDCLAFSPDGGLLATGGRDGFARIWETTTGLPIGPPLEHRGAVLALAFCPDGRRLVTGGRDGNIRIWRAAPQIPGEVQRISCWVRVTTGLDFDEADAIRKLDPMLGWELQRRLHELGGPPPRKIEKW